MAEVLTDPDQAMAQSAIVRHVDRRAAELLDGPEPEYASWTRSMAKAAHE
ncbi:hypothetical protein ACH4FX_14740 [Streptomyces sp. NPDC018019]